MQDRQFDRGLMGKRQPYTALLLYWAALGFFLTLPLENTLMIGDGTISKYAGALVILVGATHVLFSRRLRFHNFYSFVFLLFIWLLLTVLWSIDSTGSLSRYTTLVQLGFLSLALHQVVSLFTTRVFLFAYLIGSSVAAANNGVNYLTNLGNITRRFTSSGFNLNDFAIYILIAIPIAIYFAFDKASSRIERFVGLIFIPIGFATVILTGSRAGYIGLVLTVFYAIASITRNRRGSVIVTLPIILALSLYAISFVPTGTLNRIQGTASELTEGTLGSRTPIWQAGLLIFESKPLQGAGIGAFPKATSLYLDGREMAPHSLFVGSLTETGLPGFILWILLLGVIVLFIGQNNADERLLYLFMFSMLLIAFASLNFEWRKLPWAFFALFLTPVGVWITRGSDPN